VLKKKKKKRMMVLVMMMMILMKIMIMIIIIIIIIHCVPQTRFIFVRYISIVLQFSLGMFLVLWQSVFPFQFSDVTLIHTFHMYLFIHLLFGL